MNDPTSMPFATFPAIPVEQELGIFYAVAIPAKILLDVTYTDRLTAIPNGNTYSLKGSQRVVDEKRLKEIGDYIGTDEAAFPNSIILAANYSQTDGSLVVDADEKWRIELEEDNQDYLKLVIPTQKRIAPIVDGQHRLFGFTNAPEERLGMQVLCSVFLDLPRPYQAYLFATINSTQKPVDRSQTYELFGYNIEEERPELWSPEKLAVFLSRKLNGEPSGPLYQRILVAAQNELVMSRAEARAEGRWMVSTATIVDGITRLITTNPKKDAVELRTNKPKVRGELAALRANDKSALREIYLATNDTILLAAVSNFFSAVFEVCGEGLANSTYLTKTVGMQALFDTLRELAPVAMTDKDFSKDWFLEKLSGLADFDFSHEVFAEASGQGRSKIKNVILLLIGIGDELLDDPKQKAQTLIDTVKMEG